MTEEEFLKNYDSNQFFKPSVTVDSIIFTIRDVETDNYRKLPEKKLQVLLVKRAEHPYMGKWSLPGTFVRKEERFEEAVQRSLKAKTNSNRSFRRLCLRPKGSLSQLQPVFPSLLASRLAQLRVLQR